MRKTVRGTGRPARRLGARWLSQALLWLALLWPGLAATGAVAAEGPKGHHRDVVDAGKQRGAASMPLSPQDARYLLARTGFSPNAAEVQALAGMSRMQAVDTLLAARRTEAVTPLPECAATPAVPFRQLADEEARQAARREQRQCVQTLRAWWLREMATTPSPLTERMTLFWHNHFVSGAQKVPFARLMADQNRLLRRESLGNFGTLLHAIGKDPAMLIYLDGAANRKGRPNENFAREVMELFTLGEGHYSEQDIREAARAYTGWSVDPQQGFRYVYRPAAHDDDAKTVLGQTGNFDGDAVLDLLLARPETARFIVGKLWREFVSPVPDPVAVEHVAAAFRGSGYDIRVAMRGLLLSDAFWNEANRGTLVKSPAELVVGTLREFQIGYTDTLPFAVKTSQLGQALFAPPNVRGWPGGEYWINASTLLARKQFLDQLFRSTELPPRAMASTAMRDSAAPPREGTFRLGQMQSAVSFDADRWLAQLGVQGNSPPDAGERIAVQRAVLPLEPALPVPVGLAGTAYLRTLMMDPAYQLK